MGRFLLRLLVESAVILWLSFTLIFLLLRGLGDPAQMLLGQRSDQVALSTIRAQLHLDEPLWKQYLYAWADWLPYRAGRWRLPSPGTSYQYGRPVMELYLERLPATLLLGSVAMGLATLLGVFGGLWQAIRPSWLLDRLSLLLLALPGYVMGLLLMGIFAVWLRKWTGLPSGGYVRGYEPACECLVWRVEMLILPAIALALRPAAYLFQLTKTQVENLLQADFVRAARARGKSMNAILVTDILRNLLPPLATSLTQWLAGVFTGAIFIEEVFDWPGVGKLLFSAILSSDFPLLMGIAQFSTMIFILLYAIGEIISRWGDPRLRQ